MAAASPSPKPEETPAAASSGPMVMQPRQAFGLLSGVENHLHYAEEMQIIYPAGANTVLYHTDQKNQKFFPAEIDADGITCLAVNPSRRYLAVAERRSATGRTAGGTGAAAAAAAAPPAADDEAAAEGEEAGDARAITPSAFVTVFDLVTTKKRKTLCLTDIDCEEYVWLAFSSDSKMLLTLAGRSPSGQHDWTLVYWQWDKARPLASVKVSNQQSSPMRQCSFSPSDPSMCAVIGEGILRFLQLKEGLKLLTPASKPRGSTSFLAHTWLGEEEMLTCSENGDMMLFDNHGEFLALLPCSIPDIRVLSLVSSSSGFITGVDDGSIRIYERVDDPRQLYRMTRLIPLGTGELVRCLALSPSEETLAVTTNTSQLLQLGLSSEFQKGDEPPVFEPVLTPFHTGAVLGMDICTRKPLVVTCGADKSVRVWDYVEKTCELCKFFNEEAYSVAVHPSGFQLIVGFSDKLRMMNLLMEDIQTFRDIPIKACRECRFSNGGQFFAAVNMNQIQIYKTYTAECIANLRGHNNKVKSLVWTPDDSMLVSTGMDGAVYEYRVSQDGRRETDWVLKGTSFSCVAAHTDSSTGTNTMYVVGSDQNLREVSGGAGQRYFEAGVTLGQVVLANSLTTLFTSVAEPGAQGPIRCYRFPLDGHYSEIAAHAGPATRLRVSLDDSFLFTCSEDGCLLIFEQKRDRLKKAGDGMLPHSDEVLVTRAFLDEKQAMHLELDRQVEELTNQIEFQLRHRESYHKEEMVDLEERFGHEIEQERTKFELLREEKNDLEIECEENIKNLQELHAKQSQDLEASFQHKMMIEVGRYQKLVAEREAVTKYWEGEHRKFFERHNVQVAELEREFKDRQKADQYRISQIMDEKKLAEKVHAETMWQLEQDTDREIEELKEEKEARLKAEKDDKVKLRGQSGIHKRNHEELKRLMLKEDEQLRNQKEEAQKKLERIEQLNREREHNLREIKDRDKTIEDKEQRIYDLKKQNQELEKFKFVLDHNIKELKLQIDPKNDAIAEMKRQIQALDTDLEAYHKKSNQLMVSIEQLQISQKTMQDEVLTQRKKVADCKTITKMFKNDLHECIQYIQEVKPFRESVLSFYKKYCPNGVKKQELHPDIQREYNRQRDYLEKSVESLKKKLDKDSEVHRQDNMRVLEENVSLIREIGELRREMNHLKHERQQQKVNLAKMKKNNLKGSRSTPNLAAPPTKDDKELAREIEANNQQIEELKRRIADQTQAMATSGAASRTTGGGQTLGAGAAKLDTHGGAQQLSEPRAA
eukprot:gnl/TRDRNA2_/TRDRNA2_169896_c2_seq1.p1 gnl/TRDRNA2_/TRDRNA2_169896_c2~~gnl/TRDRNA2_/TRDRNA2_169896_c2_seq1.p1  ORF type:complete len:1270 (+),score=343.39 gnl/TRDRNA2_/TRDRNA2_169896_c2_seq1:135-3944(+)